VKMQAQTQSASSEASSGGSGSKYFN